MTAWEGAALLATVLGLSIAVAALLTRQPRITPETALTGVTTRLCATATCPVETVHLVLPCGAALCAMCGFENPATASPRSA